MVEAEAEKALGSFSGSGGIIILRSRRVYLGHWNTLRGVDDWLKRVAVLQEVRDHSKDFTAKLKGALRGSSRFKRVEMIGGLLLAGRWPLPAIFPSRKY